MQSREKIPSLGSNGIKLSIMISSGRSCNEGMPSGEGLDSKSKTVPSTYKTALFIPKVLYVRDDRPLSL